MATVLNVVCEQTCQMVLRDSRKNSRGPLPVIPAKAGIQTLGKRHWIPAFAGMTDGRTRVTQGTVISELRFLDSRKPIQVNAFS